MKIYHKLALGFFSTSFIVAATTCISLITNRGIQYALTQTSQSSINEVESATEMVFTLQSIQTDTQELLSEKYKGIIEVEHAAQSVKELTNLQANIEKQIKNFESHLDVTRKATITAIELNINGYSEAQERAEEKEELKLLEQVETEFSAHKKLVEQYLVILATDPIKAETFLDKTLEPHFKNKLLPLIQGYESDAKLELTIEAKKVQAAINNANKLILISTSITFLFSSFLSWGIALSIARPIVKLKHAVSKISKGSLDIKVNIASNDEVGILANSFNKMVET